MPAVQTSYTQYHQQWVGEGQEPHMGSFNNVTGLVETAAGIQFGRVVSQGAANKGVVLGGTKFRGITIMDQFRVPTVSQPVMDRYMYRENCGVKTRGPIVVRNNSGGVVAPGDPVFWDAVTGLLANAEGAATVGTPVLAGTGNGVLTKATPAYGPNHVAGVYTVRFVAAAANAGRFVVFDPQGDEVGEGNVGVAFAGPVNFTIADGSTDFAVGDTYTLPVSVTNQGPVPGARWETGAADQELAVVHLGIQQ